MIWPRDASGSLPEYHHDLALVALRQDSGLAQEVAVSAARLVAGDMAVTAGATSSLALSGIMALARSGDILSTIPIAGSETSWTGPQVGPAALVKALGTMVAPPRAGQEGSPAERSLLVQLRGPDTFTELRKLAADGAELTVSRVPVRYVQVARGRRLRQAAAAAGESPAPGDAKRFTANPATAAAVPPTEALASWHLNATRTLAARARSSYCEPSDVQVAVLDTGVDNGHPDFEGRIDRYVYDYSSLGVVSGQSDIVGHGTHVAGLIAAAASPVGVRGMCRPKLAIHKIFSDQVSFISAYGLYTYVVEPRMYLRALLDCLRNGTRVLNLSIGGTGFPSPQELAAFEQLRNGGCTIVAAMGNDRTANSPTSYPAAIPGVIAVGATDALDRISEFSSRGPHVWVSAPGKDVWSTLPTRDGQSGFWAAPNADGQMREGRPIKRERDYGALDGTSMAAPQVTAAVAMFLAAVPGATPDDVREALRRTAEPVPGMQGAGFSQDYGYGRLNVGALLESAGKV